MKLKTLLGFHGRQYSLESSPRFQISQAVFILFSTLLIGCKEHVIQSTRFGVIDCFKPTIATELCVVKDMDTRKQYMLCYNCQITDYKEKKK